MKLFEKKDTKKVLSTDRNNNISPKMTVLKDNGLESLKTKSIFSISSFGVNNHKSLERTDSKQTRFDLNLNTNKKNTKNNTNIKQSNYES